jgi:hypothetical protein
VGQHAAESNGLLAIFLLNLYFWFGCVSPLLTLMAVWHAANFTKVRQNGHYYLQAGCHKLAE